MTTCAVHLSFKCWKNWLFYLDNKIDFSQAIYMLHWSAKYSDGKESILIINICYNRLVETSAL